MKWFKKKKSKLEEEIDLHYDYLASLNPTDDEEAYNKEIDLIAKLEKLKSENKKFKVSPDALLAAGVSIAQVLIIVGYEHAHCITSKAVGFVHKPKI